jgi:dolichol-phosphate mannosyltransferase
LSNTGYHPDPRSGTAPELLAVVVPTFNESGTIVALLQALRAVLPHARLLVVDDGSPDGTADLVRGLQAGDRCLDLLVRPRREGLGPAYIDGFRRLLGAGAQRVVQMDADFSHRPEDLPALLAAVAAGADLALGSRYVQGGATEGWPLQRRCTSRGGSVYASVLLGLHVHDATGGYRCWRAELLARAIEQPLLLRQFGFQIEMLYRARLLGAAVREVPIRFPDRRVGASKMRLGIAVEALAGVWRLRLARRRALVP